MSVTITKCVQSGINHYPVYPLEDYRYYCDRINQFYKKYNICEDVQYQEYISISSPKKREEFINDILVKRRNKKIDLLLF